jgi:amino-acid N-acetyltransferase
MEIQFASESDIPPIKDLLNECELPSEDIDHHVNNFMIVYDGGHFVGVIGIEILGENGLLRSLAVKPDHRGAGLAKKLCNEIQAYAALQGISTLYLLTVTAENFFAHLGFEKIPRDIVPDAIKETQEFNELCPFSSACMVKSIQNEVHYYPKEVLRLEPDVPGAEMWGVALEKALLTYFELQPHCRFDPHSHESEQITMVLEGELFFEVGSEFFCVKQGEVIAVPSNVAHSAFTQENPAKAIDTWSPVMGKYARKSNSRS